MGLTDDDEGEDVSGRLRLTVCKKLDHRVGQHIELTPVNALHKAFHGGEQGVFTRRHCQQNPPYSALKTDDEVWFAVSQSFRRLERMGERHGKGGIGHEPGPCPSPARSST